MSERVDVLVAGEYYCDMIFSGLDAPPSLGGEAFARGLSVRPGGCYNMALGLTRLDVRTAWACDFGTDMFSRLVLEAAAGDGLDPAGFRHVGHSLQRVSAAFSGRGERGFITYREAALRAPDREVVTRLRPKWLLQTFRPEPEWLSFVRDAKSAGVRIFGDCNGEGADLATPGVREFIGLCDVFSPNEAEAMTLTGTVGTEDALARLAGLAPTIVIKRGAHGAIAIANGQRHEQPALPVETVDTVGAGDAFAAGFLAAAVGGAPLDGQLLSAVACGSLSTAGAGNSANPSAGQLRAFMARLHPTPSHASA
jgi:sugar/nucleoside kinase (ribokinase family)